MAKDYLGIPRELIPWFPTIDEEACIGCKVCLNTCPHGVFTYDESKKKCYVANPYDCVVFCQACQMQCPEGAISFPDKEGIRNIIKGLREQYTPK